VRGAVPSKDLTRCGCYEWRRDCGLVLPVNNVDPLDIASLLRRHGLRPDRRLGQNFLNDADALERIANEAGIEMTDTVVEIGPGLGGLTLQLARRARRVVAVEIDARLASIAKSMLAAYGNVDLVSADILTLSPEQLDVPAGYIVAANIPYNITSAVLRHLLESHPKPRRIVLTVQKEVAERICAIPPDMSLLSLSVQVYGSVRIVARIPAVAFYPAPKVDSAAVRIELYPDPMIAAQNLPVFFRLIKAGFSQKRKTLRNSLSSGLGIPPLQASDLLRSAGIDPQRRAEALSLAEWAALSDRSTRA
jgi:16S rRNA (adenine1518-N6/adenine1519-N6)-dimethyltransferase